MAGRCDECGWVKRFTPGFSFEDGMSGVDCMNPKVAEEQEREGVPKAKKRFRENGYINVDRVETISDRDCIYWKPKVTGAS